MNGLGRAQHHFQTSWYNGRRKVLAELGIEAEKREDVYREWRKYIKDLSYTESAYGIAATCSLSTASIYKDLDAMGIKAGSQNENLYKKDKYSFADDPFKYASAQFSYDPDTGVVLYRKVAGVHYLHLVGTPMTSDHASVKGTVISTLRLCWLLHYKELANKQLFFRNERGDYKIENIYQKGKKRPQAENYAHEETIILRGKPKTIMVDSSKPYQPKSSANAARQAGQCSKAGMCINYRVCGDRFFEESCLGYAQPPEQDAPGYQAVRCHDVY